MQIIRRYWSFPRQKGDVTFHREVWIKRDDGLIVTIKPFGDGTFRVYASGSVNRCMREFTKLRDALEWGVSLAKASPDIWQRGVKARKAAISFMETSK